MEIWRPTLAQCYVGASKTSGASYSMVAQTKSLTLLKIRVSQMEKELEGQVKSVEKRFKPFERTDEPDLYKEIKEILQDVLNELYYSKDKKETPTSVIWKNIETELRQTNGSYSYFCARIKYYV